MKFFFSLLVLLVLCCSSTVTAIRHERSPLRESLSALLEVQSGTQQESTQHSTAEAQANTMTVSSVQNSLAQAESLGVDESAELVNTLRHLLNTRKAKDAATQQQLLHAATNTQKVQVDLKQKAAQLAKHEEMLDRLETCLTKGPPQIQMMQLREQLTSKSNEMMSERNKLSAAIAEMKARETTLLEKESAYEARMIDITKREAVMKQKEGTLQSSVSLLQAREEAVKDREASLLKHMEDVSHTRQQMDEMMQTQIDQAVNNQLGAIKARLEKKHLEREQGLRKQLEQRFQQVMAATKEAVGETEDHHIALIQTQIATKATLNNLMEQKEQLESYKGKLDADHASLLQTHESHSRSQLGLLQQLKQQQQALMLAKGQLAQQQLTLEHSQQALATLRKQQAEEAASLAKKRQEMLQEEATFLSAVSQQKAANEQLAAKLQAEQAKHSTVKAKTESELVEVKTIQHQNEQTMKALMKERAHNAIVSEKLKEKEKIIRKQKAELSAKKAVAEKQAKEAAALTKKSQIETKKLAAQLKANSELNAKLEQQKLELTKLNQQNQQLKQQTDATRAVTEQERDAVNRARTQMLKDKAAIESESQQLATQRKQYAEQKAIIDAQAQQLQKQKQQQAAELAELLKQAAVFKTESEANKQQAAAVFVKKQAAQLKQQDTLIHQQEKQLIQAKAQIAACSANKGVVPHSFMEASEMIDLSGQSLVFANVTADRCAAYKNCGKCSADKNCAWCSSNNGGTCLLHDVNAALRAGNAAGIGDGLTSGQCTSDSWQSAVSARLTLLSLNVFASERNNGTRRLASILKLIKKSGADVVTFQEVEKWFVQSLQAHPWLRTNFHFSDFGQGQAPGGLYILSRYPIASVNYYESIAPGQVSVAQRGRVLVAKIGIKTKAVYVATTTLDWADSNNRAASLDFINNVLHKYPHVFLTGDFNFDDMAEPETSHISKKFLDVWTSLNANKPGYTWDPRANSFARASDPLSRSSRIDRVFLKSNKWLPRAINLVGCSVADLLCAGKIAAGSKDAITVLNPNPKRTNPAIIVRDPGTGENPVSITSKLQGFGTPGAFLEIGTEIASTQLQEHMNEISNMEDAIEMMELGAEADAENPNGIAPFDANFVPSNHYGLLVQASRFTPHC